MPKGQNTLWRQLKRDKAAQAQILEATKEYTDAAAKGDKAAMNAAHQKAEDARAGKIYNKGTIDTKTIAKEIEEVTKSEYVTKEAKSDLNKSNITYITTKTNSRIEKEEQNKIVSEINKTRKETNITEPKVTGTIGLGSIPKTTGNNTKSPNNEQKYQALFNEWIKTSPDRLKDLSALDYFKLRILSEGTKNNISTYTMEELDKIYLEEYEYKSQIHGIQGVAFTIWGIKSAYTSYIENNRAVQEAKSVGNAAKGAGKMPSSSTKVINTPEVKAPNAIKSTNVTGSWDSYLGKNTTNINPRTGAVDPNRIFSADGTKSIRFGSHEMGSMGTPKGHFHYETWMYDAATDTMTVTNTLQRIIQ